MITIHPLSTISDPSPINYNDHDGTTTERYRWMNVHGARGNGSYCDVGVCTALVCCLLLEFAVFIFWGLYSVISLGLIGPRF
ncbi:hypothetical protein ES288_D04G191100v1 [Gossypium darwinii]|uniref:Uncharacterized protein n=1 Tax=Gossypium darwinii TaxID=34276 RepID=A0A5D2CY07_GOSDA|nr:hypothetical protein ES288_D04G191100v1 [Gossypium darwinii]